MVSFHHRYVGEAMVFHEQFRTARVRRRWTIERAAKELAIAPTYIQAMEEGRWNALPGGLYARQFVRRYAELLRLDRGDVNALMDETVGAAWASLEQRQLDVPQIPRVSFSPWKLLRATGMLVMLGAVGIYFWTSARTMLDPPSLVIESPGIELVVTDPTVHVRGIADAESQLSVNGIAVPLMPDGRFDAPLVLLEGQNTIRIIAERKQRKPNIIERIVTVVQQQKNNNIQITNTKQ